jgi:hypothetical protein
MFSKLTGRLLLAVAAMTVLAGSAIAQGFSGAIWTTDIEGQVDKNLYNAKEDVYLNGGPHGNGNGALPENESFYVRVIEPGGDVLGTSVGLTNDRPVETDENGNMVGVVDFIAYRLWDLVRETNADGTFIVPGDTPNGFRTSTNGGNEYVVEISLDSEFANKKSDNFKVLVVEGGGTPQSQLEIKKFYDTNGNGLQDPGEPDVIGWKVHITYGSGITAVDEDTFTSAVYSIPVGETVTVWEYQSIVGTWYTSTGTAPFVFEMPEEGDTVTFGNFAVGGVTNGHTIGFWSNKNGNALMTLAAFTGLNGLNLRTANGSDKDFNEATLPNKIKAYNSWVLSATATNMAYMLSAQLSAMYLNTTLFGLNPNTVIFVPSTDTTGAGAAIGQTLFNNGAVINPVSGGWTITVADLMAAANTSLGANSNTTAAGPARTYQDCLKTLIDQMNNNGSFGGIGTILAPVPLFGF